MDKKRIFTPPLFIYFFSILVISLVSCSGIKDPVLNGIDGLKLAAIGSEKTMLTLNLNYHNPNRSGIKLKDAQGDAWINNSFAGHFIMDTTIKISGNSDFVVPVKLDVDMKNAMQNAFSLLLNPEVSLKVSGNARIGKGGMFFNYPIRYEGKEDLSKLIR